MRDRFEYQHWRTFFFFVLIFCHLLFTVSLILAQQTNQVTPSIENILKKGATLFEEGNYLDAYIEFMAALKIDPNNTMALQYKTRCESNIGPEAISLPASPSPEITPASSSPTPVAGTPTPEQVSPTPASFSPQPSVQPTPLASLAPTPVSVEQTPLFQNFVIPDPPGWVKVPPTDPAQIAYYQLPNEQKIVMAEYVVFLENLPSPTTIEDYFRFLQISRLKAPEFPTYIPLTTRPMTMANGVPALQHDFLFTHNSIQLKARSTFAMMGNQVYTFLLYSSVAEFDRLQGEFSNILNTVTATTSQPTVSTPSPFSLPGTPIPISSLTPLPTPVPSSNPVFLDLQGRFGVPLPTGTVFLSALPNGALYGSPNNGKISILTFNSDTEMDNAINGFSAEKVFQKQTLLAARNHQAEVKLFGSLENGISRAMLIVKYTGTTTILVIVVPQDQYSQSQPWMSQLITGVYFK
ncbi:MAG: hypothetical protein NTX88_01400 [Candidatus Atribacteria bacterium]|nr:hypothetical protein [Candidatus Atribacteria bacterium]